MARRINTSKAILSGLISRRTHNTRKVGYKTKTRNCKNPECNALYNATRSDQLYCSEVCYAKAKVLRRIKRDNTKELLNSKTIKPIEYARCNAEGCIHTFAKLTKTAKYCSHECKYRETKRSMRVKYQERVSNERLKRAKHTPE